MERGIVLRAAGFVLLLAGIVALVLAFATGEAKVALVFIIPVIYGAGALAALGILLIFGGIALLSFSIFDGMTQRDDSSNETKERPRKEYGGVILIGPIPIVFGSARSLKGSKLLLILAALSLIVLLLYLVLILL